MKVLIYTPIWAIGGIERVIVDLVSEFERHGDDVSFTVLTESPPDPASQFALPANSTLYSRKFSPYTPEALSAFRSFVIDQDPDVTIAMSSSRQLTKLPRALADTPYPVILSEHNSDEIIVGNFRSDWRFLNAVRNAADINHVLNSRFALGFDEGADVRVIPNAVEPASQFVTADSLASSKTIICTSRYDWRQKQPDVLVRAFARLAPEFPDWRLVFYGSDWRDGKARLDKLITELGVGSQIELNDPTDSIRDELLKASVFAFPSSFEGFGIGLVEAMAHGLPSVAFDFAGIPDVVEPGRNALIVPGGVRNTDGLADALRSLMTDEALRRNLSEEAIRSTNTSELGHEAFYGRWKKAIEDAAALKGVNRLANLSPMERAYIANMTSGLLFDQLHAARVDARQFQKARRLLERFRLLRVAERVGVRLAAKA